MAIAIMNQFKLTGRVSWKDEIKFFENGVCVQKILLGIKRGDEWKSVSIAFFNTQIKQTAEEVCNLVNIGDYIQVTGKIRIEEFVPKGMEGQVDKNGNQKKVSQINLVGSSYKIVKWNDETDYFEIAEGE